MTITLYHKKGIIGHPLIQQGQIGNSRSLSNAQAQVARRVRGDGQIAWIIMPIS